MLHIIGVISYNNCYFLVAKLPDVFLLIKYINGDPIFQEKFSQCRIQNSSLPSTFDDLFLDRATSILIGIFLSKYIYKLQRNWNNYTIDPTSIAVDNEDNTNDANNKDDYNKDPRKPLDDNPDEPLLAK